MKSIWLIILILFPLISYGQKEFHIFPENDKINPGKPTGDGSISNPWDLQTALNQKNSVINGGDIVWLHGGIYNGRYISNLTSSIPNSYITVSSFENDRVVLNGNIDSDNQTVLQVKGRQVIYKDFDVTFLGEFVRDEKFKGYKAVSGISHTNGANCQFRNLRIHDVPGLGFGSWNSTDGTIIEYCMIYNNGFFYKNGKGGGEGMYVQNSSDTETRIIRNNIIFGNYYKAIEVWSANRDANRQYVKNITIESNVIFNSGLPASQTVDNIIIASDDRNGVNVAKNIKVKDNILYHNTDFAKNEVNGDAPSLTLGYYKKSPVENITIDNNVIIGRNNALRLLYIKSLAFNNNKVYTGYIQLNQDVLNNLKPNNWNFKGNEYFTKNNTPYYLLSGKKFNLKNWKSTFNIQEQSEFKNVKEFDLENTLDITQNEYKPNQYRVTLFNKQGKDVTVDFSKYSAPIGTLYSIRDVEDYEKILKSGRVGNHKKIVFPMKLNNGNKNKTLDNFGVYIIEFSELDKEKKGFFERVFSWLF